MVWRQMCVIWAPLWRGCQGTAAGWRALPQQKPYKPDLVPAGRQLPGRLLAREHQRAFTISGCCDGAGARAAAGRAGLLGPPRVQMRGVPGKAHAWASVRFGKAFFIFI